jgi:hypothetical protein
MGPFDMQPIHAMPNREWDKPWIEVEELPRSVVDVFFDISRLA